MKTRKIIVYGLIAKLLTLAFIALSMTSCEQPTDNTPTLTGIMANYTGGSVAINTNVNSLKSNLTVTAKYSDNTGKTLNAADYSLSGDLSASGQKTVTVTYEGETTTFNVTVTADITYTATQTGGTDGTTDSTGIVFTFSASVDSLNLSAADITVSGAAAKGASATLTGTGTSLTLAPITVNAAGLATVAIAKNGIEAGTKHVTVYKAGESVPTLTGITAVYNGTTTIYPTTPLNNLKVNLTVKAQYSNGNEYTLSEHEYNLDGTLTVGTSTITVSYEGETTIFNVTVTAAPNSDITYTATQTGGTDNIANSTGIVFTFSASINSLNLTAADITVSGAATKGASATLTGTGTSLTLAPITVNAAGLATVAIAKEGIEAVQKSVTIYKAGAYVPEYWSITWHLNGGAEGTGAYPTQIVKGTVLARPFSDPSKAGSTFGGWYSDSGLAQPYAFANPVTTDLNLYAKWVAGGSGTSKNDAIPLTENELADGSLPTSSDVQWFTFTATASEQFIHASFGTLTNLYVQVYDSSGEAVGGQTLLTSTSSTSCTSRSLTPGQTYYIRVRPWSGSGDYRIAFNTTFYPPGTIIPLTENEWADGSLPTSSDVQWFTFTATASTQYIHVAFGTLTNLYVQVYDSSGEAVGGQTLLTSSSYTSRSLTPGQTYYIRVMPWSGSGTYQIGFTASTTAPTIIQLPSNAIPLTENEWADGNLPTSSDVQWFIFTATASEQFIHASFGTLTNLYVQVYDSGGATVGSETRLYSYNTNISRTLTSGQTYYIRVRPNSSSYSGTYRIAFNTSTTAPIDHIDLPTDPIPLTVNQWADGNLPTSSNQQWFVFTATASTQYIHVAYGTLSDLYVQVYDSSGATVGSETNLYDSPARTSRTLTQGQTYYIRVKPYGSNSGNYRIAFNTSTTAPIDPIDLPTDPIPLTVNQWADGNLPTSSDVQWFVFTATASTQYIHIKFGTLTILYVQVYDSSGAEEGSETFLSGSSRDTSRTLTPGETYYIRVRPYYNNGSGNYRIGFNASYTGKGPGPLDQWPPNAIPLTVNQWADGNLPTSSDQQWFVFTATASTQYIHFDYTGTLTGLYVYVYDSNGEEVGSQTSLSGVITYTSRSLTSGQTYYIRVMPWLGIGAYRIGFGSIAPPGATPLTFNIWAPTSSDEQWFVFTATASTQYIHAAFGTLTSVYVQVYDNSGATVGGGTSLYDTVYTASTSRTLTSGQTYYIRVRPSGSSSGTYRIAFTASIVPPGLNLTQLTVNQWADGNLPTSSDEQWFVFTATASTQYIHAAFGTLTSVYVQVYNSSGATVESETRLYGGLGSNTRRTSITLTPGQTYYIRVRPYSSSYSGTYRIAFNASIIPLSGGIIPLTLNTWADGNLPTSNDVQWFSFTATASTQYIHFSTSGTLTNVFVQVYDSGGTAVESETRLYSSRTNTSRSLTTGQTYYIRVTPYTSGNSGTYRIGFTASTSAPFVTSTPIPLTENQWADGNIPTSSDVQWFTFTATASTQYIHAAFGTLTDLIVQVYNSSGATVGSVNLYGSGANSRTSLSLTSGQTYYIRVSPFPSNRGAYRIGFGSIAPPGATPLTLNTWADGNIPTSSDEQWFTFTATAATQIIHFDYTGTLTSVYVQVYDSSGTAVGSQTPLNDFTIITSRTLTSGQTYYIRVRPYGSGTGGISGTYRIGFNTSAANAPTQ